MKRLGYAPIWCTVLVSTYSQCHNVSERSLTYARPQWRCTNMVHDGAAHYASMATMAMHQCGA